MPLTNAERQAKHRERRAADFSEWLNAVYARGYDDAIRGLKPAPPETWKSKHTACAYLFPINPDQ